ncbi:MAG: glutaredoxin family protein [Betaproteobacteria bacterium HGW-Betaproteobacteria-12]|nr:MAG: glutaredoxin family protein [Betaproteobacteria bacterium HGW-Betaproteobacteria-12]
MRYLLVLCLALLSAGVSAQAYRWVDSTGRTIISDTPPPGKVKAVTSVGEGSAATSEDLPFAVRKARENFPVTLYTAADCVTECKQARDMLNGRGIPFSEKMLQKAEDSAELKALVGDVFVPTLKVGKQSFRGFEAGAYNNLLDLAGYPKTAAYGSKPSGGLAPAAAPSAEKPAE